MPDLQIVEAAGPVQQWHVLLVVCLCTAGVILFFKLNPDAATNLRRALDFPEYTTTNCSTGTLGCDSRRGLGVSHTARSNTRTRKLFTAHVPTAGFSRQDRRSVLIFDAKSACPDSWTISPDPECAATHVNPSTA